MAHADQGFRLNFNDSEAKAANKTRDALLDLFLKNLQEGCPPEAPSTQELVERYRREYIDTYLFSSSPIQIFALGTAILVDPHNRKECDLRGEGLAEYLSKAMLAYYQALKEK